MNSVLWNNDVEKLFFREALSSFASPEQLFYNLSSGYFAYVPKGKNAEGQTLQSRNSLIGQFTEKWTRDILAPIASKFGLYAKNNVVCAEIGLPTRSNADLAFCTTDSINQKPSDIKLIFEIKMSVVSNYQFEQPNNIKLAGDYKTHKGNPSLLRSDSMLKAIGKSINIRVSGIESTKIPIVIIGNSPITTNYINKVDYLKTAGVIQGFWSLNPRPTETEFISKSPENGFITISELNQLKSLVDDILSNEMDYFSSMISKQKLGELIKIASKESSDVLRAEKFLELLRK